MMYTLFSFYTILLLTKKKLKQISITRLDIYIDIYYICP